MFGFIFLLFMFFTPASFAETTPICIATNSSTIEEIKSDISSPYFIGKMKLAAKEKVVEKNINSVEVVEIYRASDEKLKIGDIISVDFTCAWMPRPNEVAELMLLKTKDVIAPPKSPFYYQELDKNWTSLRKEGGYSQILENEKSKCVASNGVWDVQNKQNYWKSTVEACRYLAKDGGKACKDNSDCEGFCAVDEKDVTEYDIQMLTAPDEFSRIYISGAHKMEPKAGYSYKDPYQIKVEGKCTKWKSDEFCGFIVENGFVTQDKKCVRK